MTRNAIAGLMIGLLVAMPSWAENDASRASSASVAASVQVPAAVLDLLAAGAAFSITAARPVGQSVELVITAAGEGASFTVQLAADAIGAASLAVGTAVTVTAISAGYLVSVGTTSIAFIPSAAVAPMIHQRELRR